MKLLLQREPSSTVSTIGKLFVEGEFECYTLEDIIRPEKIKGKTAIPIGTYEVIVDMSMRFKKPLPRLLYVPNYTGVRIHAGNKAEDTEGCILVGVVKKENWIGNSQVALSKLLEKLDFAYAKKDPIYIEIRNNAG